MRHRLIHAYNQVDLDVEWDVACRRLPKPIVAIEPLVPPPAPNG
jgi:uncharacterized protein with HEPN domain